MNIFVSNKWLREYVRMKQTPEVFASLISKTGPSVERIAKPGADLDRVVVGRILSLGKHPNADKLRLTVVDVGGEKLNIVCGGSNLYENELVAVAKVGARVRWHGQGELVTLEPATIRGVASEGMICGANEIGLADRFPHGEKEIMDLTAMNFKPGTPLAVALALNDCVYDIEVTTNRPDALGMVGMAREAAAATGGKFLWVDPQLPRAAGGKLKVAVHAKQLCSRYIGVKISGVKVGESPDWMKERLRVGGLRPINAVVDITNYVMLELGQPLHAFDAAKIKNETINVRTAKAGEKIKALDGKEYALSQEMLVIADAANPVAVAGVIGGEATGVTMATTEIILEAASFNSASVRRTGRDLNIRTDAVMRFEKNLPPGLAAPAAARAAALVLELCGGRIEAVRDVTAEPQPAKTIAIKLGDLCAKIGVTLTVSEVKKYLSALGFSATGTTKKILVRVPYWRAGDVSIPEDLIEEVARLYGYERLPAALPPGALVGETPDPIFDAEREVRSALVNAGATELISLSLVGDELLAKSSESEAPVIRLANPLTVDANTLRPSHRARLLECAAKNEKNTNAGEVFEIGNVFTPNADRDTVPTETLSLGLAVWGKEENGAPFYRAKGLLDRVALAAHAPITYGKNFPNDGFWHAGRTVSVHLGAAVVGVLGELSPAARRRAGIESRLALGLVDFKEIVIHGGKNPEFRGIPLFPSVFRDIAFVVPRETENEFLIAAFRAADPLIISAELFDRYEGKNVPEGKKSLAYHLAYQSPERTLRSEEVEAAHDKIVKMLEHKFGAMIRT